MTLPDFAGTGAPAPFAERFAAGADVPSWLCDVEPLTPGAQRPRITFTQDVVVVGTDVAYWILIAGHVGRPSPSLNAIAVESDDGGLSALTLCDRPIFWPLATRTWERYDPDGGGGGSGPAPDPEPWTPSPAPRLEPVA